MKRSLGLFCSLVLFSIIFAGLNSNSAKAQSEQKTYLYLPLVLLNYDNAWQWETADYITLPDYSLNGPVLKLDTSGTKHLIWDVMASTNRFIFTTRKTASGWTPVEKIDNTLGASTLSNFPELGTDGSIYLVWKNELALGGPYRLMFARFFGGKWESAEELIRGTYQFPFAAINGGEGANVNFIYGASNLISTQYYFSQKTAAGWSPAMPIDPPLDYPYSINRVTPDHQGGVKLLIRSWNDKTMYISYWKNGLFSYHGIPVGIIDPYANSMLDSSNNWHFFKTGNVAIPGGTITGLYHQCLSSELNLGAEKVITGSLPVQDYSVTRDDGGKAVISWTDTQSAKSILHIQVFQGCELVKESEYRLPALPQPYTWGPLVSTSKVSGPYGQFCALFRKNFTTEYGLFCARVID